MRALLVGGPANGSAVEVTEWQREVHVTKLEPVQPAKPGMFVITTQMYYRRTEREFADGTVVFQWVA